jgi:hypothetical protein
MDQELRKNGERATQIRQYAMKASEKYFARQEILAPGNVIPDMTLHDLSENGFGAHETVNLFEKNYLHKITNSVGARHFGVVTGGPIPASVAGAWRTSACDQNTSGSNDLITPGLSDTQSTFSV